MIEMKGGFIKNLPKVYGLYTGGFAIFILIMAIAEQAGVSAKNIGVMFVAFTVLIYAFIGYLKTRIGTRYTAMIEDEKFSNSINIAKWNIYVASIADLTLYVFSYLIDKKNLKKNEAEEVFNNIINNEIKNGLDKKISDEAKKDFSLRVKSVNWKRLHSENPFYNSGIALYKWSPIAEELKVLDKEIVLNSIKLKWNIVENEFKEFTKNLNFN